MKYKLGYFNADGSFMHLKSIDTSDSRLLRSVISEAAAFISTAMHGATEPSGQYAVIRQDDRSFQIIAIERLQDAQRNEIGTLITLVEDDRAQAT